MSIPARSAFTTAIALALCGVVSAIVTHHLPDDSVIDISVIQSTAAANPSNDAAHSCAQHCGGQTPGGCWCDTMCQPFGDCCADFCDQCPHICEPPGHDSCMGWCGAFPGGCWCDHVCFEFGDCCTDVCAACNYEPCEGARGSCAVICGSYSAYSDCGCSAECIEEGNCCDDACTLCGHCKPGDLNGDGIVDVADLIRLLEHWGPCPVAAGGECIGDLNDDGVVDVADLLILLANWG